MVIWWNKSFSCGCYLTFFWFQANLFISRFESLNLVISSFSIDRQRLIVQGLSFNLVDLWILIFFIFYLGITSQLIYTFEQQLFALSRLFVDLLKIWSFSLFLFLIRFHPQCMMLLVAQKINTFLIYFCLIQEFHGSSTREYYRQLFEILAFSSVHF